MAEYSITCKCGRTIICTPPASAKCKCGRLYLWKKRSKHYVLARDLPNDGSNSSKKQTHY